MANSRYYSSTALQTSLTNSITNSTTVIQVGATTGFPGSLPYTLAIDYGAASEELVEVTGVAGLNLTVTRAIDSTSAQSHAAGATVKHVSSARDFTDSRTHEAAVSGVHGVAGTIVGTTDTQTLTNKTLTNPTINAATLSGTVAGTPTFSGAVTLNGGGTLSGTFTGTHTYSGAVTISGSLALGTITVSGTPTFSGIPVFNVGANANDRLSYKGTFTSGQVAVASNPNSETFDRFRVYGDGMLEWGPGTGARDTNLYRSAANFLKTDDGLITVGELQPQNLVRAQRGTATDSQYETRVSGDANARWYMQADGKMNWGPGTGAVDTNLYRSGAGVLTTDSTLGSAVTLSTSLTAATGFTLISAAHRKTGDITTVTGYLTRSGTTLNTTSSTSSNFTDTLLATLPTGFRPPIVITCVWGNGLSSGEALIDTDGTVTIRNGDYNQPISNGDNLRFTATWVA